MRHLPTKYLTAKYFKTDYAAILNLNIDHLERHKDLDKYAQAKIKLIYSQEKNKFSFIERDNLIINRNILKKKIKSKVIKIIYNKNNFFKKKLITIICWIKII